MLHLMCINNKPVTHENGICSYGSGLIEGEVYTANDQMVQHPNNKKECYFIQELQDLKLAARFVLLGDLDETELVNCKESEKAD